MKIDNEAVLDWQPFKGSHLAWQSDGLHSTYLILLDAGKDTSKLYRMDPNEPLCPVNKERAQQYAEIPECACGQCPDGFASAALIAEMWEEK